MSKSEGEMEIKSCAVTLPEYTVLSFTLNGKDQPTSAYRHDDPFVEGDTRVVQYADGEVIGQTFQGPTNIGGWYDNE